MDLLITAVVAFIFGLGFGANTNKSKIKKYKAASQYRPKAQYQEKPKEPPLDEQFLNASLSNSYKKQYLLNKSEKQIYWSLVKYLKGQYCINPQASLGEVVVCDNEFGYRAINSKRSDFVITDKSFQPVAVIEYQGSGHYLSNHEIRDKTKRNALNSAGVKYVELHQTDEHHIYQELVRYNFIESSQNA